LDHDAQLLFINDLNACIKNNSIKSIRKTDRNSTVEFKIRLTYELWDNIFDNDHHKDIDILFNSLLDTYLQIFSSCLPKINFNSRPKKIWIATVIKISCKKKELFIH